MKIIDLEMKRYDLRREKEEAWRKEHPASSLARGVQAATAPSSNPTSLSSSTTTLQTGLSINTSLAAAINANTLAGVNTTAAATEGDISTHYLSPNAPLSPDSKSRVKKLTEFLQSQERLLFVCFYILLNLAEDFAIEVKMIHRKIIKYLVAMLRRTGSPFQEDRSFLDELYLLILTFLKKLSIFEENQKKMLKECDIIKALTVFIQNNSNSGVSSTMTPLNLSSSLGGSGASSMMHADSSNPEILDAALKLLFNLTFDPDAKREVSLQQGGIGGGWIVPKNFGKNNQAQGTSLQNLLMQSNKSYLDPAIVVLHGQQFNWDRELNSSNLLVKMVEFLRKPNPNVRTIASKVLYNLSTDLRYRPLVERALYPDLTILSNLILRCSSKLVDRELISLAINITWSEEMVDGFVTPEILHSLIKRVHQTFDPLLIKLLRNISQQPSMVPSFKKFLHELVGMCMKAPSHEFLVESIGILSNITLNDVLYSELISQHGLLDFIMTHLQPGFADDDVQLECIQLLGTLAIDPKAAIMLANGHLIRNLFELLNEKIEDLDIVVHIVFTIFKFLLHPETREAIMQHQHLTNCLLDLVVDPSPEVRHLANMSLDIIMEHDELWRDKIRAKRFEAFNREWLQLIDTSSLHQQQQHGGVGMHDMDPRHMPAGSYEQSLGMHHDDSMDDSHNGGRSYGAYHNGHHDSMGELGESGDIDRYRQSGDSLDDSMDR